MASTFPAWCTPPAGCLQGRWRAVFVARTLETTALSTSPRWPRPTWGTTAAMPGVTSSFHRHTSSEWTVIADTPLMHHYTGWFTGMNVYSIAVALTEIVDGNLSQTFFFRQKYKLISPAHGFLKAQWSIITKSNVTGKIKYFNLHLAKREFFSFYGI